MMHHVPQAGLTVLAAAGPVERVGWPHTQLATAQRRTTRAVSVWCAELFCTYREKSQIQALNRTQPGLPMKAGRAGTVTCAKAALAAATRAGRARA
jgi:hypothetical protein